MPEPTPVFTARSRSGIEALARAEAAGKALEATGRRVRFGFGFVVGAFVGFFSVADLYRTEPWLRSLLDRTGLPGYWVLVLMIGSGVGYACSRWGARGWEWAKEAWLHS